MISEEEKFFREWLAEQKAHAKIIDDDKELHGEYKVILMERSTEPYGTWKLSRFKNGQQKPMMDQTDISKDKLANKAQISYSDNKLNQTLQGNDKLLTAELARIVDDFPGHFEVQSRSRVKVVSDLPRNEWEKVRKEFLEKGWKWDWKEKSFISEGARA